MANETKIYVGEQGAKALYKRLKEQLGKITTYQKVTNVTPEGVPIVAKPNTRTIYLVKDETVIGDDRYKEWIWNSVDLWECIGTTSIPENAWKQWSEDNGSSGEGDSVYIGKNIVLRRDESYSLGKGNVAEVTDDTDYTDTDVVAIGTNNMATNAANAYQLGRENSVINNNLAAKLSYPHSMALNLGRNNIITGEGVNVGKDNNATTFGINIGQNNFSSNASCSVGQHVMSDHSSLSMGNGEPTLATATVGNVPSMLVNGKYEHVQQFRLKDRYHLCELATIYQDPTDNKYKWAAVQSTRLHIFPNYELDQYLVSWGSYSQSGTITGYYDEEGVFHESNDTSHNIHTYGKISNVGNPSGSSRVDLNPPFYASFVNQEETRNSIVYVMRAEITLPAYGTILSRSEYEALIAGAVTPVMMGSISDLFINLDDLTADGYKLPGLTGNNALPFPLSYEVYGYKDNDVLIPYNELNKDEMHDFDWYEVDRSVIQGNTLPVKQVNPRAELIVADDRSATFGMGSLYAGGRSITISTNTNSTYQMRYRGTYETNVFHTYSGTRYTIDQETGNYSSTSATISCFTSNYGQFNSKVAPYCASADGGSIVISNNYGTAYGSSIAIGNYANADGFSYVFGESSTASGKSFAFGKAAFGYEYSMALGFDNAYASKRSIALGISGVNAQNDSIAIGFNGLYSSDHSLAFGYGGYADDKAICIGFSNYATGQSVAIGDNNSTSGGGVAIGITNRGLGGNTMSGTCIGLGISNSVGGNSFVAGNGCLGNNASIVMGIGSSAKDGSISFGIGCSGYRGAILLGIGNYTSSSDSAYGNAVVMGFGNQVYNVRQSLNKTGWTGTVTACGIAIGSYITGYGHNFISFGSKNILGDPAHWSEDGHDTVTDNDGFMTAVGFQCTAKRNYDFAYGYQSTASGGENIAFQHSSATGYRNVAMVDSTASGTGNVAIMESTLSIAMASGYDATKNLTHNTLLNAKLTSTQACSGNYGYHHNILGSISATLYAPGGAVGNVIFGGRNRTLSNLDYNPVTITSTSWASITGNMVLGNMASGTTITSENGARNNFIFNPERMSITSTNAVACNAFLNSTISLDKSAIVMFNFAHNSSISGTVGPLTDNILFGNSALVSNVDSNAIGMFKNVLFSNSTLSHTNTSSAWDGSLQPTAENFFFGTKGEDTLACVSFGDRTTNATRDTPILSNCLRVFNFGDNTIQRSSETEVFGGENTLSTVKKSIIVGDKNMLYGQSGGRINDSYGTIGRVNIFGSENKLYTSPDTSVERLMLRGNYNEIYTGCYDMSMFGNSNKVGVNAPVTTNVGTIAALNQAINASVLSRIHTTAIMPLPGIKETMVAGETMYSGWYVIYAYGVLYHTYTAPSSYSSMGGSTVASMYHSGTLQENTWYRLSSNYTLVSGETITFGPLSNSYSSDNYIVGNGKAVKDTPTYGNDRDFISGDKNFIYAGINDCVVFGNDNTIFRTYGNYGHDFIQGSNNTINDGSGSVIIGSGSIANGHMAVAIGNQLKANQWQTVIGKYNSPIDGPDRLTAPASEPTKALFIVGNGYSETDGSNWQTESLIHRSNALELYADGRLKISGKIEASNIPPAPVADGQYALACEVVSGVATYRWVAVGSN